MEQADVVIAVGNCLLLRGVGIKPCFPALSESAIM